MKDTAMAKAKIGQRIRHELQPSRLLQKEYLMPTIFSAALIGLMTTILSISFAVLVFGKAIPEALSIGIGMALISNVILHLSAAFSSSGEGIIAHVQSLPPPIQAAMLSSIMAMLPLSMPTENRVMVAIGAILLSATFTGIILFLFGSLKFGRLIRFLPLPVISGFLASVGFALVAGGITTMTNISLTLPSLPQLFDIALLFKWLPGLLLAAVLWNITRRWTHQLLFPAILAIAVVLFYLICQAQGLQMADMTRANLLLGPFQKGLLWHFPTAYYSQITSIDWRIMLMHQMGIMATIPLVCFVGGLLMLSAIEFSTGKEVNPDFELKAMGIGNVLSGIMGGGFVGYPSATFTVMQHSLGAATRLPGILSAIIPIIVLVSGANFLGFIPRFVIGGLLIYFGYQFIDHWIIRLIRHSSLSDLFVMAAIVVTALYFGFVYSVGVGIFAAATFFLFKYSQTTVIRYFATGASLRSRVTRNALQDDWLSANADSIAIFGLQGYIFFGTAHSLHQEIMARVTNTQQAPLDSIIVDFRHVTGIDTSVVQSFHKLYLQLLRNNITLIFAQLPPKFQALIQKAGFDQAPNKGFAQFANLDEALEWREEYLLAHSHLPPHTSSTLLAVFAHRFKDSTKAEILLQYLERIELNKDSIIIKQNTVARDLFFIESGRLSTYAVQAGSPTIRLQTMVDDTLIGEIGFYLGQLRTATVIANEPSVVYRLTADALAKMEKEHPAVAMELHKMIVEKTAQRINHVFKSVKDFM
jgi:SulP family sulfate permease